MGKTIWTLLAGTLVLVIAYLGSYLLLREFSSPRDSISVITVEDTHRIQGHPALDGRVAGGKSRERLAPASSETKGYFLSLFFEPLAWIEHKLRTSGIDV